jgi:hypothetical protein
VVAAGGLVIEVHRCCCPGGLLGGLGAWHGGSGGISKRGCGLGWSCFVSFRFLCIEAAAGDHAIEVHRCCCPGGLLGGLAARRGGFWRHSFLGEWVSDPSFSCQSGARLQTPEWPWCVVARQVYPFVRHVLGMLRVLPSWDARGARHKSFT